MINTYAPKSKLRSFLLSIIVNFYFTISKFSILSSNISYFIKNQLIIMNEDKFLSGLIPRLLLHFNFMQLNIKILNIFLNFILNFITPLVFNFLKVFFMLFITST